ncbi:hypothetical protein DM860_018133 [Cuscuta australis]|uniref:Ubiquitin-like protease family profile domain-containing protein n=1 Tax=Cuscuta australis TaxID=267555 RepID=A0A328DR64_9ASTE|nr:hypothetical protein DM860_018133 [Cuscuta australis]
MLAKTVVELVSLEGAPAEAMKNEVYVELQMAAGRLLGLVNKNLKDVLQPAECAFSEVSYDEFIWSDPANISRLVASEEAELVRRKFKQMVADMPFFSLGFTQDGALVVTMWLMLEGREACGRGSASEEIGKDDPSIDDAEDSFDWGKPELFFFPIMQTNWCYVLCVDLKRRRCDILDSSSAKAKKEERYGKMPSLVLKVLADFLEQHGFKNKAACIRKLEPKRIGLPWRDAKKVYEYGVATMRHMETYMGEGAKGWDCGLSKLNHKPLLVLRIKYCAGILLHEVNEMMEMVANESFKNDKVVKGKNLE